MSIQDLGSLGELIAAIATIATLVYLAYQLKQNTFALRQGSFRDVFQAYSNIRRSVYSDPEFGDLIVKVQKNEPISEGEKLRYRNYLSEVLFSSLQTYRMMNSEQMSDRSLPGVLQLVTEYLDNDIGRKWWAENCSYFDPEFMKNIDGKLLANAEDA